MDNLTNEQIVDIINFYKLCGISEDMYLSRNGVQDIYSLIGITPEFDEEGNRLPTVYEQLSIAPMFREGREVPIVFAIKHKVSKIHKIDSDNKFCSQKFTFSCSKEQVDDKIIINKLKQDYFSAVANGNLSEATRLYDLIDKLTGGKADYFIGIQYNCVKFYKKMQKQLLIDMFANFVILMLLSKKNKVKDGLVRFDKLYKAFIQNELKNGSFDLIKNESGSIPEISKIAVTIKEGEVVKTSEVKSSPENNSTINQKLNSSENQKNQTFVSFVKDKINCKLSKLRKKFEQRIFDEKNIIFDEKQSEKKIKKALKRSEHSIKILESD